MRLILRDEEGFHSGPKAYEKLFSYFKFFLDPQLGIKLLRYPLNGKEARIFAKKTLFDRFAQLEDLVKEKRWGEVEKWFEEVWLVRSSRKNVLLLVPKETEKLEGIFIFSVFPAMYYPTTIYQKFSKDHSKGFSAMYLKSGKYILEVGKERISFISIDKNFEPVIVKFKRENK